MHALINVLLYYRDTLQFTENQYSVYTVEQYDIVWTMLYAESLFWLPDITVQKCLVDIISVASLSFLLF